MGSDALLSLFSETRVLAENWKCQLAPHYLFDVPAAMVQTMATPPVLY